MTPPSQNDYRAEQLARFLAKVQGRDHNDWQAFLKVAQLTLLAMDSKRV